MSSSIAKDTVISAGMIALLIGLGMAFYKAEIEPLKERQATAAKEEDNLNGYYDPVNKIMCYWIKGSKATPSCLYADWPVPPQEEANQEPMRYVY